MRTETYYIYGISQNGQWLNPRLFVLLEQPDVVFTCVNQRHGSYLYPYYFNGWWLVDSWGQGTGDVGKTRSGLNAWITNGSTIGFLQSNGTESTTYYTLRFSAGQGGSVSYAGGEKVSGSSQTVTASPSSGYYFVSWDDGNTSASRAFTWNAANESHGTFTAVFAKYVRVSVAKASSTSGYALDSTCAVSGGSSSAKQGASVSISASVSSGSLWAFAYWSDGGAATHNVTAGSADTTYTAYFRRAKWTITRAHDAVSGTGVSSVTVAGTTGATRAVADNTDFALAVALAEGASARFIGWFSGSASGQAISANPSATCRATRDETVFAHFAQTYVEAVAEPAGAGVAYAHASFANPRQYYAQGDAVTLRAAATRERWSFLRWEDAAGNVLSTDPEYSFTMGSSSLKRKAIFHMDGINISVSTRIEGGDAQDAGYGSASVSVGESDYGQNASVYWGETAKLLATPAEGEYTLPEIRSRAVVIGSSAPEEWGGAWGPDWTPVDTGGLWDGEADYYVDGSVAETGDGTTAASPFKTLAEAVSAIGESTGKVVELAAGNYAPPADGLWAPVGNLFRSRKGAQIVFPNGDANGVVGRNATTATTSFLTFAGISFWNIHRTSGSISAYCRFVSCRVIDCEVSSSNLAAFACIEAYGTTFSGIVKKNASGSVDGNLISFTGRLQNCAFIGCRWGAKAAFNRGDLSRPIVAPYLVVHRCAFSDCLAGSTAISSDSGIATPDASLRIFGTNRYAPDLGWYVVTQETGRNYPLSEDGVEALVLSAEERGGEENDPDPNRAKLRDPSMATDARGRPVERNDVTRASWTAPVVFQKWEREGAVEQTDNPLEVASVSPDVADRAYVAVFRAKTPVVVQFAVFGADGTTPVQGADLVPGRSADAGPDPETGLPRWFSGPLPVAPSGIPAGQHIGTWRVDTWDGDGYVPGEAHQEGQDPDFDPLSFTAQVEETRIRVVGIVTTTKYTVSWQVDAPSGGHGTLSVTVDDEEKEGGTAQVPYGAVVEITASPADDGSAFRAFLDGNGSPLQHTGGVLSFPASADLSVTAKFGGSASASPNDSSLGTAGVRVAGSGAEYSGSCDYAYGDALDFLATPAGNKYFLGWACTVGGSEVAAAWGAQASYTPVTASVSATASFGSDVPEFHICLTHAGMPNMGALSIEPAGDGVAVETEDKADFDEATGCTYGEGAVSYTDDTFWKVTGTGFVRLSYAPSPLASATFSRWRLYAITDGDKAFPVYATDTRDETVSRSNPAVFQPNRHGVVRAVYAGADGGRVSLKRDDSAPDDAGTLSLYPAGTSPSGPTPRGERSAVYGSGQTVTASAAPSNGYRFAGWYNGQGAGASLLSAEAAYSFERSSEAGEQALYARFAKDASALYAFDAGEGAKAMCWRSLRYKNARPFSPSCCRVCADGRAELSVRMASSPEAPEEEWGHRDIAFEAPVAKNRQNARRIAPMRPEKYLELEVRASCRVSMLSVATSMDTLE